MYRNISLRGVREAGKTINITHSECVFAAFVIYTHTLYCHFWPARLYSIFPHYLINDKI